MMNLYNRPKAKDEDINAGLLKIIDLFETMDLQDITDLLEIISLLDILEMLEMKDGLDMMDHRYYQITFVPFFFRWSILDPIAPQYI